MLSYPDPDAPIQLVTDASAVAVGAALQQNTRSGPKPLAFFSKKLSPAEQRYSTFDRELLAVYLAVNHYKHLLEAIPFEILTDHLPLIHAINKRTDPQSSRQQRHMARISEFNCQLVYLPGQSNAVADALSRTGIIDSKSSTSISSSGGVLCRPAPIDTQSSQAHHRLAPNRQDQQVDRIQPHARAAIQARVKPTSSVVHQATQRVYLSTQRINSPTQSFPHPPGIAESHEWEVRHAADRGLSRRPRPTHQGALARTHDRPLQTPGMHP